MSSPFQLLLVLRLGDYTPIAVPVGVLLQVLITAAPCRCERYTSAATSV